jgi:outer membrane protein, heavy metal efflux system
VVLALVPLASVGDAVGADLRLADVLARAREANPAVRAAVADVAAARGRLTQARLLPSNPILSGDLARHSEPGQPTEIDRGVALAQEVEVGGQRGLRIAAAGHDVAHSEHALADRRRLVEADARRRFFALAAAERRQRLAVESADVVARLADAARRRAGAGEIATLDVRLADIERARAAQALATAEVDRAAAAGELAAILDAPADEPLAVVADDEPPAALPDEAALVARALAERPDLAAARDDRLRLESEAGLAARRGVVPNPVLRGFYRQERVEEHIAGGEISVPLPIFNREQGTQAALRAQASAAAAETQRLESQIPRQVHVALVRRAAAVEVWTRYQRDTLPAVAQAQDLLARGQAAGYLGVPDQLVQQDRLLQVRAAAIDAWRDMHVAEADLLEAVGGALP